ncbi:MULTISPECIES: MarR family transcriptional regulator [unclassified Lysinibacillus]|uniref:MarR family winged helix-turn-helix transcriptional regulator n=1 Tax=unclassified Lysinibacillus TaxID=2636778 RepID=UPI0020123E2A|nr:MULTISPECIES: MarR family transcriptional regulator [unclassified Lysinibacillus]MCL1694325.1 MarR family transcriptional regulator [Lysinibacillus sp. BPa_S21]MCL1699158.1 MarR family transcriptional regulator [Lysinibacillus sp. Bpr_S20]
MNPIFHALFQKSRYLTNCLNEVLKQHNLYSSQWTILYCLHNHGPMTLTQIWKYLNVEAPSITRAITRLENLGWVLRVDGEDKREKIVTLSPYAEENFPAIKKTILAFEKEMVGALTDEEQQQFMILLEKMKG